MRVARRAGKERRGRLGRLREFGLAAQKQYSSFLFYFLSNSSPI
jgi:hypothetical protein